MWRNGSCIDPIVLPFALTELQSPLKRRLWSRAAGAAAILALLGCGSDEVADYATPTEQTPAFWQINDKYGKPIATLIGSVHMLPDDLNWVTPKLEQSIKHCDVLVTEIGTSAQDDVPVNWLSMAQDDPVATLSERLNPDEIARLQDLDLPLPADQFNRAESWSLAIMAMQAQTPALGLETENGVEAVLSEMAAAQSKPILGLETAAHQFERFNALSPNAQDALLSDALSPTNEQQAEFQRMLTAWLSGDMAALSAAMQTDSMARGDLRQSLILTPNQKWAAAMESMVSAHPHPCFVIGTAHLVGDNSIPALLTRRGYTFTRAQ